LSFGKGYGSVNEFRTTSLTLPEIVAKTEIMHPNVPPYDHVSLLIVAWNEEKRIGGLIELLKSWFTEFVVCVQESDDDTLDIAKALLPENMVTQDKHWGHGDRSFPMMVSRAKTPWCFVVSCDETPNTDLLQSVRSATALAEADRHTSEAVWVNFVSTIEGVEVPEQSAHLRIFKTHVGWPNTLHSRPGTNKGYLWPYGFISHDRSLDEMVKDYLSYYEVGRGNAGWDAHNLMMMREACKFIARDKGVEYVTKYEWWPDVQVLAFGGRDLGDQLG
jgi:hypothetical protein